jgi:hypothetical protein
VASSVVDSLLPDVLIELAGERVKRAKAAGRDRVVGASVPPAAAG